MIKKIVYSINILIFCSLSLFAQDFNDHSAHKSHKDFYDSYNLHSDAEYDALNNYKLRPKDKNIADCSLEKIVFGWHPYWSGSAYNNYEWDFLTDLSYFSYEVNPLNGEALDTHNWSTADVIDVAIANGVRVNLCVTLFESHATFLESTSSKQTLIDNLISLVKQRNAHGVNIDFELIPASQTTNYNNFMVSLADQMHAQIPGSQVSIALHAVDWNSIYNIDLLKDHIDLFIIMGYDYYWSGSSIAGPTGQLYKMNDFNYTIGRSIVDYLNAGVPKEKLVCGLPYYGWEWKTTTSSIPASATNNAVARTLKVLKSNANNYYSDKLTDENSLCSYFSYYSNGTWNQLWIDDEETMKYKFDLVQQLGIAGIGIWALGYDDGYSDMWDLIKNTFSDCSVIPCSYKVYDLGGPKRDHFDRENYTFTIAPDNAENLSLTFLDFELEAGYDSLWIYDGKDIYAPKIGGYSGTISPGTVQSGNNALTLKFYSDNRTVRKGWEAEWSCDSEYVPEQNEVYFQPNPARNELIIPYENVLRVYVYTLQGVLIETYRNSSELDISDLRTGIYIIKINIDNEFFFGKLIIQK